MIKQSSHTKFSFKPRCKNTNESFLSSNQIPYDSLFSTILSKATLTSEISPIYKMSDCNLNTLTELTESNHFIAKTLTSKPIKIKPSLPKSPLNFTKMTSRINHVKVVSSIKHNMKLQAVKDNIFKAKSIFSSKTPLPKQTRNIPHPSSKANNTPLHKLININVNVFIQSPHNLLTQESNCKSSAAFIPLSCGSNISTKVYHTMKSNKSLSREREKRRVTKSKEIAERQHSIEQTEQKIIMLSGAFSEIKQRKACSFFREKGVSLYPYCNNNIKTQGKDALSNSIHSLESYDNESL